jgi:hypothetical protein
MEAMRDVDQLLREQSGVISRRQALAAGMQVHDLRRFVRRRVWARVHDGVFVDHTGPLTWQQRAWAGVLAAWPAALSHDSAIRAADGPGRRDRADDGPIHVAVGRHRVIGSHTGLVVHPMRLFPQAVLWNASPPRLRIEEAVLEVAAATGDPMRLIARLADAVQSRRTTAARLLTRLEARPRIAQRQLMDAVLRDIDAGTCSALEHGYLRLVERPHGLPRPRRQQRPGYASILRDIDYEVFGLVIELDGRVFHDRADARDADLERDLDAHLRDGRETVRLGWGQVFGHACRTAAKLGVLLARRGWTGSPTRCERCGRG